MNDYIISICVSVCAASRLKETGIRLRPFAQQSVIVTFDRTASARLPRFKASRGKAMDYLSSSGIITYGPGCSEPFEGNGYEYQRLLYVFGVIEAAVKQRCFTSANVSGIPDPRYLVERFFEKGVSLIREKGEGFPDATFVSQKNVVITDVCRVDASKPIVKAGKLHGSSFEFFSARHAHEMEEWSEDELEEQLLNAGITFSVGQLAKNIRTAIKKKSSKAQQYCKAIYGYLDPEDRNKNFEVWLVIEDMTPTSDEETIDAVMGKMRQCNNSITGVIYVHDVGIGRLPDNIGDVKIYNLDC